MTCREAVAFIIDYLEGDLPDDVRRRFEQHLAECPNCEAYLASYRATIDLTKIASDEDGPCAIPEDLVDAILTARRREPPRR